MSTDSCRKRVAILLLIPLIKAEGLRVFIAKRGTYGFYTDNEGTRIISFECGLGGLWFSGNYTTDSPSNGSGWRITDDLISFATFEELFNTYPPAWAIRDSKWAFTSLAEQLAKYNASSQFTEIQP